MTVCVLIYCGSAEPEVRKREFATHKKALGNLRLWLHALKVTPVAMESTGVYWKPVWQTLEGNFDLILANPYQMKTIPGRMTDARDSQWIAELLAHGFDPTQLRAATRDSQFTRSDAVPGEAGGRAQSDSQPHSQGIGGCLRQVRHTGTRRSTRLTTVQPHCAGSLRIES